MNVRNRSKRVGYKSFQRMNQQVQFQKKIVSFVPRMLVRCSELNKIVSYFAAESTWHLSSRRFEKDIMKEIIQRIKNPYHIRFIWMNRNSMTLITDLFPLSKFSNLAILNLDYNLIYSVQALTRAEMPALSMISLDKNCLTSVRCLRKMNVPQLNNYLISCPPISQFASRHLQVLYLNSNLIADLTPIFRINNQLQGFRVNIHGCKGLIQIAGKKIEKGSKRANCFILKNYQMHYH